MVTEVHTAKATQKHATCVDINVRMIWNTFSDSCLWSILQMGKNLLPARSSCCFLLCIRMPSCKIQTVSSFCSKFRLTDLSKRFCSKDFVRKDLVRKILFERFCSKDLFGKFCLTDSFKNLFFIWNISNFSLLDEHYMSGGRHYEETMKLLWETGECRRILILFMCLEARNLSCPLRQPK